VKLGFEPKMVMVPEAEIATWSPARTKIPVRKGGDPSAARIVPPAVAGTATWTHSEAKLILTPELAAYSIHVGTTVSF
jgi:hypothetical protein